MRFRIGLPSLCLLGLLPFAAAADPTAPVVRPGLMKIALDPEAVSFLPMETEALRQTLCSGFVDVNGLGTISPRGECDLSVSPPPGMDVLVDATVTDASLRVSVQPKTSPPWEGSVPVVTPCGTWDVSMVLDPTVTQPVSELALEPSATDPKQGVFAGTVKLAVRYRFYNRNLGTQIKKPAVVSLELSGHWAAVPEGGPSLGSGTGGAPASNLVLFAGVFQEQWSGVPGCGSWGGVRCGACFRPPPDVLDALTPSFNP